LRIAGNHLYAARQSWQDSKQDRQFGVGALGNIAILAHQMGFVGEVKARVAAQEMGESIKITLEPRVDDDLFHGGAYARHFAQFQRVDLLVAELCGDRTHRATRVPGLTIGEVRKANFGHYVG
jgi:hypothetical protein